jgi:hypothetical protein
MITKRVSLESPVEEKIAWARSVYKRYQHQLYKDQHVAHLLGQLENAVSESRKAMARARIIDACKQCEEAEGGSCCAAGLERKYDGWLILINLLLGARLPKTKYGDESCFFLGPDGCTLKSRHVMCVNYLCKKITDRVDSQKIRALREKEGRELDTLFRLHEQIKRCLEV